MESIKSQLITTFGKKRRLVCTVQIYLVLHELLKDLGPLLFPLLCNMSELEKILQEIIYCLGVEVDILSYDDDINSILVEVILTDILCIPELQYNNNHKFANGTLTVIEGVVIGMTHVHLSTKAILYSCPDNLCPGSDMYLIQHTTYICKESKKLQCKFCSLKLREEIEKRLFSERVEFLLLPKQESRSEVIRFDRSIKCTVQTTHYLISNNSLELDDKLIPKLPFGRQCFISGVPYLTKTDHSYQWQFKVYGIENIFVSPMDPCKCALSTIIENLPDYVHAYEFGTAFMLAFMFLDNITKAGSFFLLKWLLLLLLVQNEFTKPKDEILFSKISCRPPALLLVGSLGNTLPNKILKEAGRFAKPFCERKPGGSVLPTSLEVDSKGSKKPNLECIRKAMKKQNTSGAKFIELDEFCTSNEHIIMCGTIETASGGIAYFPNLELYKKKELTNLIYALENMTVDNSFSDHPAESFYSVHKHSDYTSYPNETTIWATAEVNPVCRKKVKNAFIRPSQNKLLDTDIFIETKKTNKEPIILQHNGNLKRIIHAFDIVVDTEEAAGPTECMDELLVDFYLSTACNSETVDPSEKSSLSDRSIYSSLLVACKNAPTVKIEENSSQLLKVYYLAMRCSSIRDKQNAPASALPTLFKLAKSNAKLNGRIVANECDAAVAIYIYDGFICNQTGTNYLHSKSLHYISGMERESMEELNNTLVTINKQLKDLMNTTMNEP